jgi:hypothetical protein
VDRDRPPNTFIHILDDDSLLNIFYFYRPLLSHEDESNYFRVLEGGEWALARWWYRLAQVCRRWRYIILGSPSHLGLCLLSTYGTPVADMLAHSPPLPLILDYLDNHNLTAEDEEGIRLALQHCDRVHRIRLEIPVLNLQNLLAVIDKEFPILEYLFLAPSDLKSLNMGLTLPNTFQASQLRYLILMAFAFPIGSPLLITTQGLVTLSLLSLPSSSYFHPNELIQRLPHLPHLEKLMIDFDFHFPISDSDLEEQLLHTPIVTRVTLPTLRWLSFFGISAYLEALLPRITTPLIRTLHIVFPYQPTLSVPHLQQFLVTAEDLNFYSTVLLFHEEGVYVSVFPRKPGVEALHIEVCCRHLDWQVSSAAQILNALRAASSAVEYLTVVYQRDSISSEWRDEADRSLWRDLLRPFSNVKKLRVHKGLVRELSRTLLSDDGESQTELLPELKVFEYPADDTDSSFSAFSSTRGIIGSSLISM